MKNKEIVKEIKGMQAKLETLIGKIEKKEKAVAGWYILLNKDMVFVDETGEFKYGITHSGGWATYSGINACFEIMELASPEEIETRLIQEAEKRGFKEGCTVKYKYSNIPFSDYGLKFSHIYNELCHGGFWLMSKGKWAEIIEEPKLTLGGHEVTVNGKAIFFNGGFIYLETARNLVDSNIEEFRMSCQPDKLQVDELKELLIKIDSV